MNQPLPLSRLLLALLATTLALLAPPTLAADTPTAPAATESVKKAAPKKHFLLVLRLPARLHDDQAWTASDKAAVGAHFARLKEATAAGQVILAGRTPEPGDKTQGLVIFNAPDEAAARAFMAGDPCVAAGVMLGELHPFDLALLRKN